MPARKGSIEGIIKRRLQDVNYIGRNFWKYLPIGNEVEIVNETKREYISGKEYENKLIKRRMYTLTWVLSTLLYLQSGIDNNAWTIMEIIDNAKTKEKEKLEKREYKRLFNNIKNFDNNININENDSISKNKLEGKL